MYLKEGVISFETNIRYTFTWATRTSVIVSIIIFFDFIVNIRTYYNGLTSRLVMTLKVLTFRKDFKPSRY